MSDPVGPGSWEPEIATLAHQLGYSERLELPELGGDRRLCFCRTGQEFALEAICFIYQRKPRPLLIAHYVGSPLSPHQLREQGLERNGLVENLFEVQFSLMDREPVWILPPEIEMEPVEERQARMARLRYEMTDVEARVWPLLWAKWMRLRA